MRRLGPVVLFLGLLGLLVWQAGSGRGQRTPSPPLSATDGVAASAPRPVERVAVDGPAVEREAAVTALEPAPEEPQTDCAPRPRASAALVVEVREPKGDEQPVEGVEVELLPWAGPHPEELAFDDGRGFRARTTCDERGEARFPDVPVGPYALLATAADGRRATHELTLREGGETVRLVLSAHAPGFLVRVVDLRGDPVPEATVELSGAVHEEALELRATTDAQGRAHFDGLELLAAIVIATAPDGRAGMARIQNAREASIARLEGGQEIVVEPVGSLTGSLVGVAPEALVGARVVAHALSGHTPGNWAYGIARETAVVEGRYRFEALAPGTWTLTLLDPGGARLVLPRLRSGSTAFENSVDPLEVEVRPGMPTLQDLTVTRGGTLTGLVRRPGGEPVGGARVRLTYTPRTPNFPEGFFVRGVNVWRYDSEVRVVGHHPLTHPVTHTDADGRYRLDGLFPGLQRVEVFARELSYDRREDLRVEDGETVELENVLSPAGAIQGVDPQRGYLGVTKRGEERARMIVVLPGSGSFAFPGLEEGVWELARFHSDPAIAPVPLATVAVRAGETAFVDLTHVRRPIVIRGRVLGSRGPVVGADVSLYPTRHVTDDRGRFETMRSFPLTGSFRGPTVVVAHAGFTTLFRMPHMEPGEVSADWNLVFGSETLRLLAVDATGTPTTARVELEMRNLDAPDGIEKMEARDLAVDGERLLDGLAPGDWTARARFASGAEAIRSFQLPLGEPLVLAEPEVGALTVMVRFPDGRPAPGLRVAAWTWNHQEADPDQPIPEDLDAFLEGSQDRNARTDDDGRAHIAGLAAGEVALHVFQTGFFGGPVVDHWERFRLGLGEERELDLVVEEQERSAR